MKSETDGTDMTSGDTAPDADRISAVLAELKQSKFRSRFTIRGKYAEYVHKKGMDTIRSHAVDFITARLAPAMPVNDGKQTPMKNHPVFIAQHATGTCCRGCLLKWHNIPKSCHLVEREIEYVVDLIMTWIETEMDADKNK